MCASQLSNCMSTRQFCAQLPMHVCKCRFVDIHVPLCTYFYCILLGQFLFIQLYYTMFFAIVSQQLYLVLTVTTMFGEGRGEESQISQLLPLLQMLLIGSKEEPFLLQLLRTWSARMAFQRSHVCEIIQIVAVQLRTKLGPYIWADLINQAVHALFSICLLLLQLNLIRS